MAVPDRLLPYLPHVKAGLFALFSTFVAVDITTGQAVIAGVLALLSAVLAAWLASRPGVIRERSQSRMSQEQRHIQWLQERIQFHSSQVVLVRKSKHDLLNYVDSCHVWIHKAQAVMGEAAPPFEFRYYDDLCGDEDRGMVALTMPSDFAARSGEIHLTGGGR